MTADGILNYDYPDRLKNVQDISINKLKKLYVYFYITHLTGRYMVTLPSFWLSRLAELKNVRRSLFFLANICFDFFKNYFYII